MRARARSSATIGLIAVVATGILLAWQRSSTSLEDDVVIIEARGRERAWRFSYGGPDGDLGTPDDVVRDGQLALPSGVEVWLQLRSDDFIYVFSCPDLDLKEIAVPDLEFSLRFRTEQVGEHALVMDPMCGFQLAPGETMGKVSVLSERAFRRWLGGRGWK